MGIDVTTDGDRRCISGREGLVRLVLERNDDGLCYRVAVECDRDVVHV